MSTVWPGQAQSWTQNDIWHDKLSLEESIYWIYSGAHGLQSVCHNLCANMLDPNNSSFWAICLGSQTHQIICKEYKRTNMTCCRGLQVIYSSLLKTLTKTPWYAAAYFMILRKILPLNHCSTWQILPPSTRTQAHTHTQKHKQSLSLEARLAEAETSADGLFGACGRKQWEIQPLGGKQGEHDCLYLWLYVCVCGG